MSISQADRRTLEKFHNQAKKVFDSKLIQSGFSINMNLQFDKNGLDIQITEVDEEQLKAVLVDFRPLILNQESIFLPKIFNLIETIEPNEEIINMGRQIRANRKKELNKSIVQINHDGDNYSDESMFDLILNSGYFHLDDNKSLTYEKLPEIGKRLGNYQFLSYLYIEIITILNLYNCVGLILEVENPSTD